MKKILPKELLDFTLEVHRHRLTKKRQNLYLILILLLVSVLSALPLIKLDVYSTNPGMIRSRTDKIQIISPASGYLMGSNVSENKYVVQGDTLLVFDRKALEIKESLLNKQLDSISSQITDLSQMLSSDAFESLPVESEIHSKTLTHFRIELNRFSRKQSQYLRSYNRQRQLYQQGVIAMIDLEMSQQQYQTAKDELSIFLSKEKSKWAIEVAALKHKKAALESSLAEITNAKRNHMITAPVSGYIQHLSGLEVGAYVPSGTVLFELIPESGLMVKCLVSPDDISWLQVDQTVDYHLSSFNRQRLGILRGKVESISPDINFNQGNPFFEVHCSIDSTYTSEKKTVGRLKNGMALIARFRLARRSVFDLLMDDLEELGGLKS